MMVAPERLVPGTSAKACATPTFNASSARHLVDRVDTHAVRAAFCPENDEPADDKRRGHRRRVEQVGLQRLAEHHAQRGERHERDGDVEQQAASERIGGRIRQDRADLCAELPDDRQDRPGLDDDLEQLAARVVKIEQRGGEDQVPGARDREKLGETFDDPEDGRLKQQDGIHAAQSSEQARQYM